MTILQGLCTEKDVQVFPIIAVMGAGGALVTAILSRNALSKYHPQR
jgi:hypothetical protein